MIQVILLENKWVGIGIGYETPVLANHSLEEKNVVVSHICEHELSVYVWAIWDLEGQGSIREYFVGPMLSQVTKYTNFLDAHSSFKINIS